MNNRIVIFQGDIDRLCRLQVAAMERQRNFVSALITAFPALGLYATLQGLIAALSNASGIVAGSESERVAATEIVTSTLGSCFATTLIALLCMAVFAIINVKDGNKEIDVIEGAHRTVPSL
jgi:flagellar motor component MotA